MNRREFFRGLFATGVVATVPQAIFYLTETQQIEKKVRNTVINFNDWGAMLIKDDAIIAQSRIADLDLEMERPLIDVTPFWPPAHGFKEKEFMPGPATWKVRMHNVYSITEYDILTEILRSGESISLLVHNKSMGTKYSGDCCLTEVALNVPMERGMDYDLHLMGIDALTMI